MKYDATLKRLFRRPPDRLLAYALGFPVAIQQALPTEQIVIGKVHPDLLLETTDGRLLHIELQGYTEENFACRNLVYYALVLRDYKRPPMQIVFWVGDEKVGITGGLDYQPELKYQYRVIDVREMDPAFLLEGSNPSEWVFAILCKLSDPQRDIAGILRKLATLPSEERREGIVELLILSGLRGWKSLVQSEVKRMPISIDIHENEFLEEIFQEGRDTGRQEGREEGREEGRQEGREEGRQQGAAKMLRASLSGKFGAIPSDVSARIDKASISNLEVWSGRIYQASTIYQVFED